MLKIAVIGTGFIASIFMRNIETIEGTEVASVHAINREEGRRFSEEFNIPNYVTEYEDVLNDDTIDCVYIGLPNHLHFSYANKALQAKKHVIVEKPFVTKLDEVETLRKTAKEKDVFVFDAITTRHMPNLHKIKKQLCQIGNVKLVTASYSQYSSKYTDYINGIIGGVFTKKGYGGALSDVGIYNISLAVSLFGKPKSCQYFANMMLTGVDSSGVAVLDYGDFKFIALQGKDSFTENYIHVQGEKGTLIVDNDPFRFSNLRLVTKGSNKILSETTDKTGMYHELTDFINIIEEHDIDAANILLDEASIVVEVMEKLRNSAGIIYDNQ